MLIVIFLWRIKIGGRGKGRGGGLNREGGLINFPTLKSGGLLEWGGGINRGFAVIIPSTNSLRRLWPKTLTLRFETRFRTIRTQACALVLKTVQYSGEDVGGCTSPPSPLLQLRWPAAFKYNWYSAKSLTIVVYWYWSKTWDEVDMVDLSNRPHFLWVYRRYNPLGCWENTRKPCKLRAFKWVIKPVNP